MDILLNKATVALQSGSPLIFILVFIAGLATAANPCVLSGIPLVMAYVGGTTEKVSFARAFFLTLCFSFGLAVMFTSMGLAAALLGSMFGEVNFAWKYVIGGLFILMGLSLLDVFHFPSKAKILAQNKFTGALGAFIIGLGFGLVSAPCAAPMLVILLTYIATGGKILYGTLLLLTYSLAHCALIFAAGISVAVAKTLIESRQLTTAALWTKRVFGVAVIVIAVYIIFH